MSHPEFFTEEKFGIFYCKMSTSIRFVENEERKTRFELATLGLGSQCSTTELLPLIVICY